MQVLAWHGDRDFPGRFAGTGGRGVPAARRGGSSGTQAGGILAGGFPLDSQRRTGLFGGEHPARDDGHQPPPTVGQGRGNGLRGAVRADLPCRTRDGGTMSGNSGTTRITRWVFRIAAGLVGAYVLLATVFTAPGVAAALRLDPASVAANPWTLVTYPLVHENPLHLLFVVTLLFITGPVVERHLGGRGFVLFWVYCTVGTAVPAIV